MLRRILISIAIVVGRIQSRSQARETAALAGEALTRALGRPVTLRIMQSFHGVTLRCAVQGNGPEKTVIVKRVRPRGRQRYDPAHAEPMAMAYRFFNEWAGIEFATRISFATPALLAADRERGFLVMEDFGDHGFDELLMAADPGPAKAAALKYAAALGQLHAASRGRQDEYDALRDRLGPRATNLQEVWGTRQWFNDKLPALRDILAGLGLSPAGDLDRELEQLAESISNPGPFLVYIHGDPGPDNLRLSADRAMLIDFEHGGFRHAFTDGSFVRMLLPMSWRVNRMPDDLVKEMEAIYRHELAAGIPEAGEDGRFAAALLEGCAFWLVFTLVMALRKPTGPAEPPSALEQDQQWGLSSLRQIVLARLQAFSPLAERLGGHPALARESQRLEDCLKERWGPVADLPVFPAFRGSGTTSGKTS